MKRLSVVVVVAVLYLSPAVHTVFRHVGLSDNASESGGGICLAMAAETTDNVNTTEQSEAPPKKPAGSIPEMRRELEARKAKLEAEFNELAEARKELEAEREKAKSVEAIVAYKDRLAEFNQRAADYERKRAEFAADADRFSTLAAEESATSISTATAEGVQDQDAGGGPAASAEDAAATQATEIEKKIDAFKAEKETLQKSREGLDKEYTRLMEEKERLDTRKKNRMSRPDLNALKDDYKALQEKIDAYEAKARAHEEEVNRFNTRVKAAGLAVPNDPVEGRSEPSNEGGGDG